MSTKQDLSKFYDEVKPEEFKQQNEGFKQTISSDYINPSDNNVIPFLEWGKGINIRRIYPPHKGTKLFIAPKTVNWFSLPVWVKAEDNTKEVREPSEQDIRSGVVVRGVKRKPIFNARTHYKQGEKDGVIYQEILFKDFSDFYIFYATKYLKEKFNEELENNDKKLDKKEYQKQLNKILDPINNWKLGIKPTTTFVSYADNYKSDGTKIFGKQEWSNGQREQLNTLGQSNEGGKPIIRDVFSHPLTGKAVQITYNPDEEDNKKKYSSSLLWDREWPLSFEELEKFSKLPSLTELFVNSFKYSDAEKQILGIQIFDEKNKFNFLQHPDVQEVLQKFIDYYPSKEEEQNINEEETTSTTSELFIPPTAQEKNLNPLSELNREELLNFIEFHQLDVSPKARHNEERIVDDIIAELEESEKPTDIKSLKTFIQEAKTGSVEKLFGPENVEEEKETSKNVEVTEEDKNKIKSMKDKYSKKK